MTPLVARGIDPLVSLNMASLISPEPDFMGTYENVDQLDMAPAGLNAGCLNSASCLGGIASANGTQAVVTGALAQVGNKFDFFLVLYDNGRIVRKKEFTLPNVPSVIADSMGAHVKELVTGEKPAEQNTAVATVVDAGAFDDFEDDDDIVIAPTGGNSRRIPTSSSGSRSTELDDFDLEDDGEDERRAREEEERRAAAAAAAAEREREPERQRAEEERRREEARRAEAAAARERELERQRAEDERRREEERRAAAAAAAEDPEEEEDFDFSFGGGVTIDEEEEDDSSGGIAFADDDPPARRTETRDDYDFSDDPPARSSRYDLDEDERRTSSSRSSSRDERPTRVRETESRARLDERPSMSETKASIALRGGVSRFQDLNFVTYGAEAAFMATPNLAIIAGAEAYSTRRVVPVEQLEEGQLAEQWNTILPLNAGLQYKFGSSNIRPYVGGGLQIIPGVVKDSGGVAMGLRARGGADFAVTDVFGFNINVAAGLWSGQQFERIEDGFGTSAMVPQLSAGTIFLF